VADGTTGGADGAGRGGGEGPRTRDHLANVRTMLAWMRVGIALLTIGFSLDRLGLLEVRGQAGAANPYRVYGIGSACAGTIVAAGALLLYLRQRSAIEGPSFRTSLLADVAMIAVVGAGGLLLVVAMTALR
jgi:putative membrane protein